MWHHVVWAAAWLTACELRVEHSTQMGKAAELMKADPITKVSCGHVTGNSGTPERIRGLGRHQVRSPI